MFHPDQVSTRRRDMGEIFVAVMVALSAVAVGMSIELQGRNWQITWDVLEHVFTIVFFLEMICKLCVLRLEYFRSGWNFCDCVLVFMVVVDNWVLVSFADDSDMQR